jgi:hypothetical protein
MNFFRGTMVVFVLLELFLVWRAANILVIVAVPLLVGLTINLAIRVVPGWEAEVAALRDPGWRERRQPWRLAIVLGLVTVIVLSAVATLLGYGPIHA